MRVRPFVPDDFPTYRRWYADAELDRQVGPMDEEWLAAVLEETDGVQLSMVDPEERLVAVVGLTWAAGDEPAHAITDLAVDPARRRQGHARRALELIADASVLPPSAGFVAFVLPDNPAALALGAAIGATARRVPGDPHGLWELRWPSAGASRGRGPGSR